MHCLKIRNNASQKSHGDHFIRLENTKQKDKQANMMHGNA